MRQRLLINVTNLLLVAVLAFTVWGLLDVRGSRGGVFQKAMARLRDQREMLVKKVPASSKAGGPFQELVSEDPGRCVQGVDSFVTALSRSNPAGGNAGIDLGEAIRLSSLAVQNEWYVESLGMVPSLPERFGGSSRVISDVEDVPGAEFRAPPDADGREIARGRMVRDDREWRLFDVPDAPDRGIPADRDGKGRLWFPVNAEVRCGDNGFAPLIATQRSSARR